MSICTIGSIPLRHFFLEFCRVSQFPKFKRRPSSIEDVGLLWEIPIMGVVKGVFDEVTDKHLDSFGGDFLVLQHVGIDLLELNLNGGKLSV
jgi:hypothetical protein